MLITRPSSRIFISRFTRLYTRRSVHSSRPVQESSPAFTTTMASSDTVQDTSTGTDVLKRLRGMFQESQDGKGANPAWDKAWQQGLTPWDSQEVQPALRELVDSRWDQVGVPWSSLIGGDALVAGCGRGYDATFFASKGLSTVGMDLSATAIERAQAFLAETPNAPDNVTFSVGDFFAFTPPPQGYTLAYDYTFFCALPPDLRAQWGQRYAKIIKPGGLLICLEFPIDGDRPGGPPFSVSSEAYEKVLSESFTRIYSQAPGNSAEGHSDREIMSVWQRKG